MTIRPVVVVGDVALDVLIGEGAAIVPGGDVPSEVRAVPGGAGGNTAAWLAVAGMPVALVARVGDDEAGAITRARLEAEGVVCRFVIDADGHTGAVVVLLKDGDRSMLADRGANATLTPSDVDLGGAAAALGGTGPAHLHLSGFVLTDERSRAAGLAALDQARSLGWTTSVDPQAANHIERVGASAFLDWVRGVDLLLPNATEAQALGGEPAMLSFVGAVAVSDGAAGARWASPTHTCQVSAPEVSGGDTTGCGDAFDAGVLTGWLCGAPPEMALALGVELGSRVAAQAGAQP